jgi:hypothetical protein
VSYFTADKAPRIGSLGSLAGTLLPDNPAYTCEVSCIDWYGNTRPIFYKSDCLHFSTENTRKATSRTVESSS